MRAIRKLLVYPLLLATGETKRLSYLREYDRTQFLSSGELRTLQSARLCKLLKHANEHCAFYRRRFNEAGFGIPVEGESIDIRSIPPLSKSDIQRNQQTLRARCVPEGEVDIDQTGGSTGEPISFAVDRDRRESRDAGMVRHDRWAGLDYGMRRALIWGAPRDLPSQGIKAQIRRKVFGELLWLDAGSITDDRMFKFHHELGRFRPPVFVAYASAMLQFAEFYRSRSLRPFSPKSIITSAEVLTDRGRQTIEDVFQTRVFNRYGCREVGVIASECEFHCGMHVMAEGLYVEIVNEFGEHVGVGEEGDILVTDLLNYGMPLIRYQIGDRGIWGGNECKCGRGLPLLASVNGRVTEFIKGADEQLVSGVFLATYVIAQRPSLGQVQIVQRKCGRIAFRIRPGLDFDIEKDKQYLFSETRRYVGQLEMEIEIVDAIPREPSGKLLFCKSEARD